MSVTNAAGDDLGFTFKHNKNGEVWVAHHGRQVTTLRGAAAADFLAEIDDAGLVEQQQLMARITGNYKRGNERLASNHPRNRS
ncbi:MAG: hypothetical protein U1F05_00780 [Burkholderiales bacterium]